MTNLPTGITRRNNRYRVRVQYKGVQHDVGSFENIKVARLALERYQAEAALGTFVSPADQRRERKRQQALLQAENDRLEAQKMTVREWSNLWLQSLEEGPKPRAAATLRTYRSALNAHILPVVGNLPLTQVTSDDINRIVTTAREKGLGSARSAAFTARAMMNRAVAVNAGGLDQSPIPADLPSFQSRERTDDEIPTGEEVALLSALMGSSFSLTVDLAAWCALRLGEVLGLQRADFTNLDTPDRAKVRIARQWSVSTSPPSYQDPKANSVRTVTIPAALVPKIEQHLNDFVDDDDEAPLFPSPQNRLRPVSRQLLMGKWNAARAKVHPGLSFHALRHYGLTAYAQAGATIDELMRRAGHSDVQSALRYQHAASERDQMLAAKLSDAVKIS